MLDSYEHATALKAHLHPFTAEHLKQEVKGPSDELTAADWKENHV